MRNIKHVLVMALVLILSGCIEPEIVKVSDQDSSRGEKGEKGEKGDTGRAGAMVVSGADDGVVLLGTDFKKHHLMIGNYFASVDAFSGEVEEFQYRIFFSDANCTENPVIRQKALPKTVIRYMSRFFEVASYQAQTITAASSLFISDDDGTHCQAESAVSVTSYVTLSELSSVPFDLTNLAPLGLEALQ